MIYSSSGIAEYFWQDSSSFWSLVVEEYSGQDSWYLQLLQFLSIVIDLFPRITIPAEHQRWVIGNVDANSVKLPGAHEGSAVYMLPVFWDLVAVECRPVVVVDRVVFSMAHYLWPVEQAFWSKCFFRLVEVQSNPAGLIIPEEVRVWHIVEHTLLSRCSGRIIELCTGCKDSEKEYWR